MSINIIIPARYGSSRLPGKPLADINGKPMIVHVWEKACQAKGIDEVWVATDHEDIKKVIDECGGNCVMTMPDHPSGTDRCMEAYVKSGMSADAIINIQGDEPLVDPIDIGRLAQLMQRDGVKIGTLIKKVKDSEVLLDPNKVKVVVSLKSEALYFSRSAIPHMMGEELNRWLEKGKYFSHIGMYGYQKDTLRDLCLLPTSDLEGAEKLEQLRWLENGYRIHVTETQNNPVGIDTMADLERVRQMMLGA